jgi:hypothetical protein
MGAVRPECAKSARGRRKPALFGEKPARHVLILCIAKLCDQFDNPIDTKTLLISASFAGASLFHSKELRGIAVTGFMHTNIGKCRQWPMKQHSSSPIERPFNGAELTSERPSDATGE